MRKKGFEPSRLSAPVSEAGLSTISTLPRGEPCRDRTCDLQFRKLMLCPTKLRVRTVILTDGPKDSFTLPTGKGNLCETVEDDVDGFGVKRTPSCNNQKIIILDRKSIADVSPKPSDQSLIGMFTHTILRSGASKTTNSSAAGSPTS